MNKEDLLIALRKMLGTEEQAVPLYAKYMIDTIFLSPFANESKQKIAQGLTRMHDESKGHRKKLEELVNKIQRSSTDVY